MLIENNDDVMTFDLFKLFLFIAFPDPNRGIFAIKEKCRTCLGTSVCNNVTK